MNKNIISWIRPIWSNYPASMDIGGICNRHAGSPEGSSPVTMDKPWLNLGILNARALLSTQPTSANISDIAQSISFLVHSVLGTHSTSNQRLPDARHGKVLSLHHLESRNYTYNDTQLLRYNDINRLSPLQLHRFERTDRTPCSPLTHRRRTQRGCRH